MNAIALRLAVARQLERLARRVGGEDLQIRGDRRAIAIDLDIGERGKVGDALLDRAFMGGGLQIGGDLRAAAPFRRMLAEFEHHVIETVGGGVFAIARIGTGRMARNQIQYLEAILDIAQTLFEAAILCGHEILPFRAAAPVGRLRHYSKGASQQPPGSVTIWARQPSDDARRGEHGQFMDRLTPRPSLTDRTRRSMRDALEGRRSGIGRLLPFFGPAVVTSIAYIDPGNFATNIQAGAHYGYRLLWVVLLANLIAMLFQALSAKLGIVTGRNLAEMCRDQFSRPTVLAMWIA